MHYNIIKREADPESKTRKVTAHRNKALILIFATLLLAPLFGAEPVASIPPNIKAVKTAEFKAATRFSGECEFTGWGRLLKFEGNFEGLGIKDFASFEESVPRLEKMLEPFVGLAFPDTFKLSKQEMHYYCGTGLPDDWVWIPSDHTSFVYKQKGHALYGVEDKYIGSFAMSYNREKGIVQGNNATFTYELMVDKPRLSGAEVLQIASRSSDRAEQFPAEPKASLCLYSDTFRNGGDWYKAPLDFYWFFSDGFYAYKISDRWGKICRKAPLDKLKASHAENFYYAKSDSVKAEIDRSDAKTLWMEFWDDGGIRSLSLSFPSLMQSELSDKEKAQTCFQKVRQFYDQEGYELVFDETWAPPGHFRWIIKREGYDPLVHDYDCLTVGLDSKSQTFRITSYLAVEHNLAPPSLIGTEEAKTCLYEVASRASGYPWEIMSPAMKNYRKEQFKNFPFYQLFYPADPYALLEVEQKWPYRNGPLRVFNRPRIYREAWIYDDYRMDEFAAVDAVSGYLLISCGYNRWYLNVDKFVRNK
ncbi:MAG TPA: hypothetical protein P5533_02300 [Candidatus Cloacimonadota bacterium]|nr:hypothetical protein [Candidatus Cloacimonadota bacterium]